MPIGDPMKCPKCGRYLYSSDSTLVPQCDCDKELKPYGLMGWICPICGRANSPHTATCPCKPLDNKITC